MQTQVNEDELQKAIDDITNSAQDNAATADSATPEVAEQVADGGDLPDFGAPVAPVVPEPGTMPDGGLVTEDPATAAVAAAPVPAEVPPVVEAPAAEATPVAPEQPAMTVNSGMTETVATVEAAPVMPEMTAAMPGDMAQVKAGLLRDLTPLMNKMSIEPERKFHIYQEMMITNQDKSVIPEAYDTARQIADEQKRGEALLTLLDAVDG